MSAPGEQPDAEHELRRWSARPSHARRTARSTASTLCVTRTAPTGRPSPRPDGRREQLRDRATATCAPAGRCVPRARRGSPGGRRSRCRRGAPCESAQQAPAPVDDDHAPARARGGHSTTRRRRARSRRSSRSATVAATRSAWPRACERTSASTRSATLVASGTSSATIASTSTYASASSNRVRRPTVTSPPGAAKRKPTPRTVSMYASGVAELAAQPAHVDVERLRRSEPVLVPHPAHEVLAPDDLAGVLGELAQQVELLAAQLELRAPERRAAGERVDLELADADRAAPRRRRPAGGRGPAQDRADPRDDLGGREGLDDVVVGAELEPDDAVGLRAARGEHDHRDAGFGAQRAADVAAVAVGQHEVEQHEVRADRRARAAAPRRPCRRSSRRSPRARAAARTARRSRPRPPR